MDRRRIHPEHLDEPIRAFAQSGTILLRPAQSVGGALDAIRSGGDDDRIAYFYVASDDGRLAGVVPARRLLAAAPTASIGDIMVRDVVAIPASASVLVACEYFVDHRFLALPVVDDEGVLVGTVDVTLFSDEMSSLARHSLDDVFQLIGVHVTRTRTTWSSVRDRFPWLLCNVAGGLAAAAVAARYARLLEAVVALSLFIPVVLTLAESVSIQSVTLTLQGLHAQFAPRAFLKQLRKELATATLLGLGCGLTVAAGAAAWQAAWEVAAVVGVAIWLSMITACLLGVLLPAALHAVRADPKIAAGPIVLASADLITLIFYFQLAGLAFG